jgi:hypothetical protein
MASAVHGPAAETKKTNKQNKKQISMKKFLSFALAAAFLISAPGMASAKDKSEKKGGSAGKVTAVDDKSITISHGKGGESQTFKVDDSTKVTLDDKDAKIGDIKVGAHVKVTEGSTAGTAASIAASTHHGKKGAPAPAAADAPAKPDATK